MNAKSLSNPQTYLSGILETGRLSFTITALLCIFLAQAAWGTHSSTTSQTATNPFVESNAEFEDANDLRGTIRISIMSTGEEADRGSVTRNRTTQLLTHTRTIRLLLASYLNVTTFDQWFGYNSNVSAYPDPAGDLQSLTTLRTALKTFGSPSDLFAF